MKRFYDTTRWRRLSRAFLDRHPLCEMHERRGRLMAATVVDHITPHKGDYNLFWDQTNWQALCKECHDGRKRRQELHGYSQACGKDGMPLDPGHPWRSEVRSQRSEVGGQRSEGRDRRSDD